MDFNQAPYFDDFDEDKQYYKVLFKPGVAVQTRELNQLQTILQNQVTKFGNHVFKDGSMVIPGQVNYNDKVSYVKLASTNLLGEDLGFLEDQILTSNVNEEAAVEATVIKAIPATDAGDPITLIVVYTRGYQDTAGNDFRTFTAGATLYVKGNISYSVTAQGGDNITGPSAVAAQQPGVYYLGGYFVTVPKTVVVVQKYVTSTAVINAKIGIVYTEEIVTYEDDNTLLDNAAGTTNVAAPGADRYKINTDFVMLGLEESQENFFELIRIESGVLQQIINASQYNILEEALAERTYDESGNYVVKDFSFEVRESRNNDRGTWLPNTGYLVNDYIVAYSGTTARYFTCVQSGITAGGTEPALLQLVDESQSVVDGSVRWRYSKRDQLVNNRGYYDVGTSVTSLGNSSQLVLSFGPGRAYIRGFKVDKLAATTLNINKSRETATENNRIIATNIGNYAFFDPNETLGMVDVSTGPEVEFYDRIIGDNTVPLGYGNKVGVGRLLYVDNGVQGTFRIGFDNIRMNLGKVFERDANMMIVPDPAGTLLNKSYQHSGLVRYFGPASGTSGYVQLSGAVQVLPNLSSANDPNNQLNGYGAEGSTLYFGQGGNRSALWQSWNNNTSTNTSYNTITGFAYNASTGFTAWAFASATMVLRGVNTAFTKELLIGETVTIQTSSNTVSSWIVTAIANDTTATISGGPVFNQYTTTGWSSFHGGTINSTETTGVLRSGGTSAGTYTSSALSGFTITAVAPFSANNGSYVYNIAKTSGVGAYGNFSSQLSIGSIIAFCAIDTGIPWTGNALAAGVTGQPYAQFVESTVCPINGYTFSSASTSYGLRTQQWTYQNAGGTSSVAGNISSYMVIGWGDVSVNNNGLTIVGPALVGTLATAYAASGIVVLLRGTDSNPVKSGSIAGSPAAITRTARSDVSTSAYVRVTAGTLFGIGTSNAVNTPSRLQTETRNNQQIYLDTATQNNATTIQRISTENRALLSFSATSAATNLTAWTSQSLINGSTSTLLGVTYGTWYSGVAASFASEVFDSFALGINTRRLSGLYKLQDYNGSTGTATVHTALRITGDSTAKFTQELRENDLVKINDNRIFITHISSNNVAYGISMDGSITGSNADFPMLRISNKLVGTEYNSLVFKVADALTDLRDNSYYVYKTEQIDGVLNQSAVTITLAGPTGSLNGEQLFSTNPSAFIVAENTVNSLATPATVIAVNVGATASEYVLTVDSPFQSNRVRVVYPVLHAAANGNVLGGVKSKTLIYDQADEFLNSSVASRTILTLTNSDVYRVNKIMMATGFVESWTPAVQATAVDITTKYAFRANQTNNYYGLSFLTINAGQALPSGSVKVWYDYFEHGLGDFFSLASYSPLQVPRENMPEYNGTPLSDVLDFRSRIDPDTNLLIGNSVPKFDSNFITDLSYYLRRKESVLLDRRGRFYNVTSASALAPREPEISKSTDSLTMYQLTLQPYTTPPDPKNISIVKKEYQRYTMRDIGDMNRRLTSLEEISALNLLEVKTKNLQVRDNADPTLERYKTGFFVDSFKLSEDYSDDDMDTDFTKDSGDPTLYPSAVIRDFDLMEKINFTGAVITGIEQEPIIAARALDNYRITGETITLDYTTSTILQQTMATTSIAVAPFLQANFIGNLELIPDSDIWTTTVTNENAVNSGRDLFTQEQFNAAVRGRRVNVTYFQVAQNAGFNSTNVQQNVYPFMRANTIVLRASGLLPNTKHYVFLDEEPLGEYVTGAMRFKFDSMPVLDFSISVADRNQWAKWRGIDEFQWTTREELRTVWGWRSSGKFGPSHWGAWQEKVKVNYLKAVEPRRNAEELALPNSAFGNGYRKSFERGRSVYHYNGSAYVGSAVAMYQKGTTLYCVNARGSMSRAFMKSRPLVNGRRGYTYPNVFYVAVDQNDPKLISQQVFLDEMQTSDDEGNLYSDNDGVIVALFDMPNNALKKFLGGDRTIRISDTLEPDDAISIAEATYTSKGIQITVTRSYETARSFSVRAVDPIAQSFKIPDNFTSGAFVTDVDLYFQKKPSTQSLPVSVEIRVCDATGRPDGSGEMVPGSETHLLPEQVNVDATTGRTPTKFTFKNPVYLLPNKNYAMVVRTDSINYRVWTATLGQVDLSTSTASRTYNKQALLGSFFKSQDGTLWSEDQLTDLKFRLNRAVFTQELGTVKVVNKVLPGEIIRDEPLMLVHGSNKIRVTHINHGHAPGDKVRLASRYWASQYALNTSVAIFGIPVTEIFGAAVSTDDIILDSDTPLTISTNDVITQDSYVVQVTTPANLGAGAITGITAVQTGGDDVRATYNQLYHTVTVGGKVQAVQGTTLRFEAGQTGGFTYDSTLPDVTGEVYERSLQTVDVNNVNFMDDPKIVLSGVNEFYRAKGGLVAQVESGGVETTWKESFAGTFTMSTDNDAVSPAIDLSTLSVQTHQWRLDNPTRANRLPTTLPAVGTAFTGSTQFVDYEETIVGDTTIAFDAETNSLISTTPLLFQNFAAGLYVVVSGSNIAANNSTSTGVRVVSINDTATEMVLDADLSNRGPGDAITIYQIRDFVDERSYGPASANSKYISRRVNLENPATSIKMLIDANIPSAASFDVYYKVGSATERFETQPWSQFTNLPNYNKEDRRGIFSEIEVNITDFDDDGNAKDLPEFTSFQVKIVMRSTNGARFPSFRNLRIIAHA